MKKLSLIFLLLILALNLFSQGKYHPAKKKLLGKPKTVKVNGKIDDQVDLNYTIRNYGIKEGLPNSSVRDILIDSRNIMWLTTYGGGIVSYDGISFTNYTTDDGLLNNQTFKMTEDHDGNIWFATDEGVNMFDGKRLHAMADSSDLGDPNVWSVYCDSNNEIWIGTASNGIFRMNKDSLHHFSEYVPCPVAGVYQIMEDSKGRMWFANVRNGATMWDGDSLKYFAQNTIEGYGTTTARAVFEDSKGNIWIGTVTGALKIDGEIETFYSIKDGMANGNIGSFYEDENGLIWMATQIGISILDPETGQFKNISSSNGLYGEFMYSITGDNEGNIWISNAEYGLAKYEGPSFTHLIPSGNHGEIGVNSVFVDNDESIWFGSKSGLHHYKNGQCITYLDESNILKQVSCITRSPEGQIWLGTGNCMAKFDEDKIETYNQDQNVIKGEVADILFDKKNRIWAGGRWGVTVIEGDSVYLLNTAHGMPHYLVNSLSIDDNQDVWFGTYGGGLCMMNADSLGAVNNPFLIWGMNEGLRGKNPVSFSRDNKGNMWIATFGDGIKILKEGSTPQNPMWNTITKKDGLLQDNVLGIRVGSDGVVWATTSSGLNMINFNDIDTTITCFEFDDGFLGIESNWNQISIGKDNSIWIATVDRVTNFNSSAYTPSNTPPSLQITDVKLFQETVDWNNMDFKYDELSPWYLLPKNLVLDYSNNHVSFDFKAIMYNRSSEIKYQWMLENFDVKWNPVSDQTTMAYPNLSAGTYTFKVRAKGANNVWSEVESFEFKIQPPYWQTWWFRFTIVVLGIFLVWSIIKKRTKTLRKRQRELEATVEERTEEIRQQKNIVDEKNTEILDSINYAKRIQEAILPAKRLVKEWLPNSFILYKPKDIVAGDFYWVEPFVDATGSEGILFAAADCTGHGVPGAMVSVVCNNAMNRAVREFGLLDPGKILDKTRELVIEQFEKSDEDVKDGMDISLCSLDGMTLKYAGANNPIWIIRNDEVLETKATKQPIGKVDNPKPFTTHTIELQKRDLIYLFSDGYVDQFGGEKGKKFKSKAFKTLLLSLQDEPMDKQREILDETFEEWKGNLEQIDDVCVIGSKI